MELTTFNFWGKTKYWWGIMLVGILLIPAGLWLLFQPVMGYAVISMLRAGQRPRMIANKTTPDKLPKLQSRTTKRTKNQ